MKALLLAALLALAHPPAEADALSTLEPETRARVLKEVYRAADLKTKPRNALGFAKDIPGPEMEALLKASTVVTTDAMRELALQRGLAVPVVPGAQRSRGLMRARRAADEVAQVARTKERPQLRPRSARGRSRRGGA